MLLIIEDNLDLVNLYRLAMKLSQVEPQVETTGPAALRRIMNAASEIPNAVILDLHLKKEGDVEVSGRELFTAIRLAWPATRIIVVSADIVWCAHFQGVADAVVEKPIADMREFLKMIQDFLASGQPTG